MNTKHILLVVLISVLACSQITIAGYIGDSDTVIRLGKFGITPYVYVIEPYNSTHIQSINASGYTYKSSNASQVVIFAMGNMTIGTIFFRAGNYSLDTCLQIPNSSITFQGDGYNNVWFIASASMDAMINTTKLGTIGFEMYDISLDGSAYQASLGVRCYAPAQVYPNWQRSFKIERVKVIGVGGSGLTFINPVSEGYTASVTVNDCTVRDCKGGINLNFADSLVTNCLVLAVANDTDDVWQANLNVTRGGNIISNFYAGGGYKNGMFIEGDWCVFNNIIVDYQRWHGIVLSGACNNTFTNTRVGDCGRETDNTYDSIRVRGGSDRNVFSGASLGLRTSGFNRTKYGIYEEAGSDYNVYQGFTFTASGIGTAMVKLDGTGSLLRNAQGYTTEAWGSLTNTTATTFAITHGLNSTPTFVSCGFNSSQISSWWWTATSTTITITVANSATTEAFRLCSWYAKFDP